MRILWVANVKLPIIYQKQGLKNEINAGGWLDRISQGIIERKDMELLVCYPYSKAENGKFDNLLFRSLVYEGKAMRIGKLNDEAGISGAKIILEGFKPDVIHIHGTEFQYDYFFAEAAKRLGIDNRLVVSIQGMVSVYAKHVALGLPGKVRYANTPREFIGRKNVQAGISNFDRRGKYEEKTIQLTNHVIGRTTWDRACTYRINPKVTYHVGNETLRENFYSDVWSPETCVKHRIFISQASYPVKGFHLFLEALGDIKKFFPDVSVHVAGTDLMQGNWLNGSSYAIYIRRLMEKKGVASCVHFCGSLNAQEMKTEMLESNVFVSPSTIENSPNSVGEAMLLGVPVVSSNVGGVMDMIQHTQEGFLYQCDASYMLAYYVMKIFDDRKLALRIGQAAKIRAEKTHNYEKNLSDLLNVYKEIARKGN